METVDNAEVRIAVSEFHQYLSDHIAPLMFTDSAELLLRYPASALAGEVNRWKGAQASRAPGVAAADFLFHAVKKFAVMGELDLVSKTDLATYLKDLSEAVLEYCPEADRENLRRNLEHVGETEPVDDGPLETIHRQGDATATTQAVSSQIEGPLTPEATLALRRLSLFLEHLQLQQLQPDAAGERRGELASQFVTTAAVRSSSVRELEQRLAPLRQLGIDTASGNLFKAISDGLPGWGSLPSSDGEKGPPPAGEHLRAMRQMVLLAEDESEVGKRFRELVLAVVEQFNQGHLGRASMMAELALQLVAEGRIQPMFVDTLRNTGHEKLDLERLKSLSDRPDSRPALRKVLALFKALQPDALLEALDGENSRERRHELLTILEIHQSTARAKAFELLNASVSPGVDVDPFFQMNLIYLLRTIERPEDASVGAEVNLVMRACNKQSPAPMVKQAIAFLAQSEHEHAERTLLAYLQVFENMLLQPETRVYSIEEIEALLERTCTALARYGSPRAWRALIDHGLKTETGLGNTVSRLIAAGHHDLSKQKDLLGKLVGALKAEMRSVLGFKLKKNDEKRLALVQALAGTPAPEVRELMEEIAQKYPGEKFAEAASKALAGFDKEREPAAAGLSGDLDLFGLPTVLQILSQTPQTGVLSLLNSEGALQATLAFEEGLFRAARFGELSGDGAVYQLFVRPFPGTFAFATREDIESSHGPLGPPQQIVNLILEGVRRHDEWNRAAALVPDEASLKPTDKPTTPLEGEDKEFSDSLWEKVTSGATAAECEASLAVDCYRVRQLLAHWVEEEALMIA